MRRRTSAAMPGAAALAARAPVRPTAPIDDGRSDGRANPAASAATRARAPGDQASHSWANSRSPGRSSMVVVRASTSSMSGRGGYSSAIRTCYTLGVGLPRGGKLAPGASQAIGGMAVPDAARPGRSGDRRGVVGSGRRAGGAARVVRLGDGGPDQRRATRPQRRRIAGAGRPAVRRHANRAADPLRGVVELGAEDHHLSARPAARGVAHPGGHRPPRTARDQRPARAGPRLRPRHHRPAAAARRSRGSPTGSSKWAAASRWSACCSATAGGPRSWPGSAGCGAIVCCAKSSVWKAWEDPTVVDEMRHVNYAYNLAVRAPAAKEIRLFGLADWTVDRYFSRRKRMVELMIKARSLKKWPITLAIAAIAGGNVVAVLVAGPRARRPAASTIGPGHRASPRPRSEPSALAFGEVDWWFRQGSQPVPVVLDLVEDLRSQQTVPTTGRVAGGRRAARRDHLRQRVVRLPRRAARVRRTQPAHSRGQVDRRRRPERRRQDHAGQAAVPPVRPDGWRRSASTAPTCRDLDLARVAAPLGRGVPGLHPVRAVRWPTTSRPRAVRPDTDRPGVARRRRPTSWPTSTPCCHARYAGGTDLSGGQWQRVALARALHAVHAGAGVVLLDEPTAQLDVRGEAEIFDRILQATKGRTTILISHRFATVRHADLICVLEHGKVIELGTHDELIATRRPLPHDVRPAGGALRRGRLHRRPRRPTDEAARRCHA